MNAESINCHRSKTARSAIAATVYGKSNITGGRGPRVLPGLSDGCYYVHICQVGLVRLSLIVPARSHHVPDWAIHACSTTMVRKLARPSFLFKGGELFAQGLLPL